MSNFESDLTLFEDFLSKYDKVMAFGDITEKDEIHQEYVRRRKDFIDTYGEKKGMWIYSQSTGILKNEDKGVTLKGYSGSPGFVNKPESQTVKGKGVIPLGFYKILSPVDSKRTGKYVLNLSPDSSNEMFGRSAFQIHGDSVRAPGTASNGCIIINQPNRTLIWETGDRDLKVVE